MFLVLLLGVFLALFLIALIAAAIASVALQRFGWQHTADEEGIDFSGDSPLLLRGDVLSTISPWASLLARFNFSRVMKENMGQADLDWTVGRVTLGMLLIGAVTLSALVKWTVLPWWAAILAAGFVASMPYFEILRRRAGRLRRIEEQFPDALDALARVLRAGQPFAHALELVARESPQPVAGELRRTSAEANLGLAMDRALDNLAERVPAPEVSLFAAAVQIQSRSGGKLNEVFSKLSEDMREAVALRGEIGALSSQGRMASRVLTLLPLFIAGVMTVVNPDYLNPLFEDQVGKTLAWGAAGALIAAHFVIRRIVDIKM